ncbi:diguanylate cyclase domain-containing protein [Pseudomonas guineae]|uniref:diguanylate cyclase domain-containing protein n=1 Tax=Pseudomonas guineae TaxID=425504 RepID=UPI0030ECB2ED
MLAHTPLLVTGLALLLMATSTLLLLQRQRRLKQQLHNHRALLDASANGLLLLDDKGLIHLHNAAASNLLSANTSLQGTALQQWLPQLAAHDTLPAHQRLSLPSSGIPQAVDIHRIRRAGRGDALVLTLATPLPEAPAEDVERFKRSQYFACIGTWDWSIDTDTLYWSEAIYAMFGFKQGEVTPSYSLFCSCVHPDDREQVRAGELQCIESGHNHDEEYRVVWPDGSIHWLRETGNVVKDASGQAIKMMGVVRDISAEKASVSQLEKLAHHDPLTGLPNRLQLEEHMARSLSRAHSDNTRMALVFIDLNGFKQINDEHGHAVGDQLLVGIAQRLLKALRESDFVARLGGDEFVVIIEGLSRSNSLEKEAQQISEKILQRLAQPMLLGHTQHTIGASLGVAMYPDHGPSIDSLIHIADQAMYRAKSNGNNQYYLGLPASREDEG